MSTRALPLWCQNEAKSLQLYVLPVTNNLIVHLFEHMEFRDHDESIVKPDITELIIIIIILILIISYNNSII